MRLLAWLLAALLASAPASAQFLRAGVGPAETVFDNGGVPWLLSVQISAENYDQGGLGVAYNATANSDPTCLQSTSYRTDTINLRSSTDGVYYQICGAAVGFWYRYTINAPPNSSGPYVMTLRVADGAPGAGGSWGC